MPWSSCRRLSVGLVASSLHANLEPLAALSQLLTAKRRLARRWNQRFIDSIDLPVIGMTEQDLRSISIPVCIVPGSDKTHSRQMGEVASKLIPGCELHVLLKEDHLDMAIGPANKFEDVADEHARVYLEFMNKHAAVRS